jgi:CRP/FNR family cyclic AMP-dependent transcriptional regulator
MRARPEPQPQFVPGTVPGRLFDLLAPLGQRKRHAKGSVVVHEGEPGDSMFLIHSGELRAFVTLQGGRVLELNALLPGEFFGELILGTATRTATVEVTATAQLTTVSRQAVESALRQHPELALDLIGSLISRVVFLTRRVQGLVSMDVYGRMVRLLAGMAVQEQGRCVVPGPLTQQAIAERVGSSRSMINRLLKDLVAGGYIELAREAIVLLKPLPLRW